jgi:hypothetical protein
MGVKLGIVIIHYNTPQDLARCLESLRVEAPACAHAVVVVDNASTAPGLDEVRAQYPACTWLLNEDNRGYARGCNQGLAAVAADYTLILNPDIVVLPGALDTLVALADARPRAGIIGPQLLNDDGSIQESCRRFYTFKTLVLRRTVLGRIFPRSRTVASHLMRDFDHRAERPVDWVLGGCMLVRRDALTRCGPMDERFFLYFEDVDWCTRMWRSGFEVLYTPAARFVHRHRRASARGPLTRSFWLHLTSLVSFYEKWGLLVYLLKKWRQPLDQFAVWATDMVMLGAAFLAAYGVRGVLQPLFPETLFPLAWYSGFLAYTALLVTTSFLLLGRYNAAHLRRPTPFGGFSRQLGLVVLLLLAGSYLGRQQTMSRAALVLFLGFFAVLAWLGERALHRLRRRMERGYFSLERTLLVGLPADLEAWLVDCPRPRTHGIDPVGYVTPTGAPDDGAPALAQGEIPWLGAAVDLPTLAQRLRISQIVFWQQPGADRADRRDLARLRRASVRLRWRIDEAWLLTARARGEQFGAAPSGVLDPDDKRVLDRGLAFAAGLVVTVMALPFLGWQRLVAEPRGRQRRERVDCGTTAGHSLDLDISYDPDGRARPLWEQWGLAQAMLRGRVFLTGQRLVATDDEPDLAFWQMDAARPGLTGAWAASRTAFWRDPGGLGRVTAAVPGSGATEER